jgi:chemotaxis family two-component system sensor kinase Cph1
MVQELLSWARISHEELRTDPVDLNEVVKDVCVGLRAQLEERGATLRVANALPVVLCNRIHLHRVLTNLVTNGVKYNERTEKTIEIGTQVLDDAGLAVYVRDNGIGIEPRNMHKLFNLLVQLHKAERFGKGVGMGLAIVKKTVEAYNGRVWAESTYGLGTTFWFTLPLADRGTPS